MPYQAVADRIIIIPEKVEEKIGGVYIPDSSKGKSKKGLVVNVGSDCKEVKPGYEIFYLEGQGALFHEDGQDKLVLKEGDSILGYFDKTEVFDKIYEDISNIIADNITSGITHLRNSIIEKLKEKYTFYEKKRNLQL